MILAAGIMFFVASPRHASAQGLNWEGQTGAFITPFAYTMASPAKGVARPQVSFHYLDTGNVVGGYMQTNASLFGIAGNASAWQGRFFGATAFVFTGPAKSTLIVGSEFAQQPHFIEGLQGATVPTSFTYFVRIVPAPERLKLNVDFGVAQAIGATMPGVELAARGQFAMGGLLPVLSQFQGSLS